MRVAAIQTTAGADRTENLERTAPLLTVAADRGVDLMVLPELFDLLGPSDVMQAHAQSLGGDSASWLSDRAAEHNCWIHAGISEATEGSLMHNTSVLFDRSGALAAVYRKVHLFDNDLPGAAYQESAGVAPGDKAVLTDIDGHLVGLTTCYDLRFPELFRQLTLAGAELILLPSAFTHVTGAAHWEPLLRARAIENQVFVVAANQIGRTGSGIICWGHSTIVDPWGVQLATCADIASVIDSTLDFGNQARIRKQLPALSNRRPSVYEQAVTSGEVGR